MMQQPQSSGHKSVSEGCLRRMRVGLKRESMYGKYNSGQENGIKPLPVVQILRWQGDKKEWVVIDLVPETSEPHQSDKKTQAKTAVKDIFKKSEGITSEPQQSDKISSSKKAQEKPIVNNGCKKLEGISSEPHQSEKMSSSKKTQEKSMVKNTCKKGNISELRKSEKMSSSNNTQEKSMVTNKCKKGITSELCESEKMFSSNKTQEKAMMKNSCKKAEGITSETDTIKTCFCFDWKQRVLPKCMKKLNENQISNARITNAEAKNNKTSPGGNILTDQRRNANPCEDEAFENSPILPPKGNPIQTFVKTKNNHSDKSFSPDRREEGGQTIRDSTVKGNHNNNATLFERHSDSSKHMTGKFCKAPTKDAEADKVLKAAILVTEATIKTAEEMKEAKKCDIVVKNMGYKADIANKHRPIWDTVAPGTKFNLSKQAENNNLSRVSPEHLTNSSAKAGNIETTKHLLQKCPKLCVAEKTLKKSEAEKDYILGLLNSLIYEVAKKKTTEGEDDQSLKDALGNSKILFADEAKESEPAEKLDSNKEKCAVDCAMKTLEEVNGFETSRSWC